MNKEIKIRELGFELRRLQDRFWEDPYDSRLLTAMTHVGDQIADLKGIPRVRYHPGKQRERTINFDSIVAKLKDGASQYDTSYLYVDLVSDQIILSRADGITMKSNVFEFESEYFSEQASLELENRCKPYSRITGKILLESNDRVRWLLPSRPSVFHDRFEDLKVYGLKDKGNTLLAVRLNFPEKPTGLLYYMWH